MASTNKTINYKLSQYTSNDKPTYLSDYNSDMNKIDTQMKANNDLAGLAKTEADDLSSRIDGQDVIIGNLNTTVGQHTTDINTLNTNVSAVDTKVGDLTNLNTTDKTDVVKAVNEVNTKVGDLTNLNTTDKTDVVSAVNEVNTKKEVFSTNELKTNKVWIDGKPIYRKTVVKENAITGNNEISLSDLNYDYIVITEASFIGNGFVFSPNRYNINSVNDIIEAFIKNNAKILDINVGSSWNNINCYITLEYTKTTD